MKVYFFRNTLLKAFLTRAFCKCFHECAIFPALVTLNIDSFPRLEIFCKVIHVFRRACSENTVIFHLIGILKKVKRDGQMLFASVVKGNIRLFTSSFLMFVK